MEVVVLGTGSADGWPNPFCGCASCAWARADGQVRGQTAALVDGALLLDCGPETARAAERAGRPLTGVRHVLVTHAHPDHLAPAVLLWRRWAGARDPLDLVGPAEALAACRDWLGPDDPVRLRPVRPGETLDVGGFTVRALPAEHEVPTVLYDVTGPDAGRLLYATDTGPLPERTLAMLGAPAYDVVLLEETFGDRTGHGTQHLDLETFPCTVAALRDSGAVDARTDVVAVHLGHHNPPGGELDRRLAAWGARTVPDGTVLTTGTATASAARPARRTLVLGGARSGKSTEAERLLAAETSVTYVATARPELAEQDAEWAARVKLHRDRRPASWRTVETDDVASVLRTASGPVLVDCLSLWLGGAMERPDVEDRLDDLVAAWRGTSARVVAVSNEVGSGVVPASESGRAFRDLLGRLNTRVAAESDEVLLTVAGRVLRL